MMEKHMVRTLTFVSLAKQVRAGLMEKGKFWLRHGVC